MKNSFYKDKYITVSGEGPKSIIFLHGNLTSSALFNFQFEDENLKKYKLIAIDFPGHGKSTYPDNKEKEYSLFGLRDSIVEIIEHLQIKEFIFAGHSLGGHVAIECIPQCENCKGLMIWGTPPVSLPLDTSRLFLPNPDVSLLFKENLTSEELLALEKLILNDKGNFPIKEIFLQADPEFRTFFPQSLAKGMVSDESSILRTSEIPIAILHGRMDPAINKDYINELDLPGLWKNELLIFDNAGHSLQIEESDKFNTVLAEFAHSVF